jgi:predicted nucleic acid-binding protein
MTIADTSVWVQHFRRGLPGLVTALNQWQISLHPVVLGELATGNLEDRVQTLTYLRSLPQPKIGAIDECLEFLERHSLYGRGIGWNDIQLLAAARLSGYRIWTLDRRLAQAALELHLYQAL